MMGKQYWRYLWLYSNGIEISANIFYTAHTKLLHTSIEANSFKVQALAPSFVSYFINYYYYYYYRCLTASFPGQAG